jgi:hypothetical protein
MAATIRQEYTKYSHSEGGSLIPQSWIMFNWGRGRSNMLPPILPFLFKSRSELKSRRLRGHLRELLFRRIRRRACLGGSIVRSLAITALNRLPCNLLKSPRIVRRDTDQYPVVHFDLGR